MFNRRAASGEGWGGAKVDLGERYSMNGDDKPLGNIVWLGRNLSAFDDSATEQNRGNSQTHISVWGIFCLYEYFSDATSDAIRRKYAVLVP